MKYYKRNICNSCGKENAPLSIFNDKIQQKKLSLRELGLYFLPSNSHMKRKDKRIMYCVKRIRIRKYSGPNAGKCGPE